MRMAGSHRWVLFYMLGTHTAQLDGFFPPLFLSSFAFEIVLRIPGGVNVGADTQQCLAIIR